MCSRRQFTLLLFIPCLSAAAAVDTLSVEESLTGDRTLVSEGGKFELDFFSPAGNSNYYVGIWYKQIPDRTVIWVMNRDRTVAGPSSSELTVAQDGNLVLLLNENHHKETIIWQSLSSSRSTRTCNDEAAEAVLLDTGNLVLRCRKVGNSPAIIWQSFDHPTDTLMPGAWIGLNKSTGEYQALGSWRIATDPGTGLYMDRVDPHGSGQYAFMWNATTVYHYVGAWTGQRFAAVPEMAISGKYEYAYVNDEEVRYSFQVNDPSAVSKLVMSPHGQLSQFDWSRDSGQWLLHWATPTSQCDVYSVCGAFGLCEVASSQYCRCLPGFAPATSPGDWSGGCARRRTLRCGEGAGPSPDGFLPVQNVKLTSNYFAAADAGSSGDCASACLSNCSCTAYAYNDGCLVWHGDLRNVQQLPDGAAGASTLFLRLAAADLAAAASTHGARTHNLGAILAAASSLALLMILCVFFVLAWLRRRRERTIRHDGSLLVFTHGYLARCTRNFCEKIGTGSFGSVYRGTLPDRTVVVVKRLEGSAQGEKQFRAEVRTLGTIQHVNLVRLRGFCVTRRERLLVYDYMPNGSLASAMSGQSFRRLDWRARFGIMPGVARGLNYLHEQCQERIVHCDVKPENIILVNLHIILDEGFRPKVADFGMAKLIGWDFSRALTTTRGTLGYLAPEWILGLPVTPKADVFSYGMTLLELISGRRNRDAGAPAGGCYFPLWAAARVGEGRVLEVLDERLEGEADMEELWRACNVACWFIQQREEVRPTMGQVVQVLEGSLSVGVAPVPRFLEQFCVVDSCTFEVD